MLFLVSGITFLLLGLCTLLEYRLYRLKTGSNFDLEQYFSDAFVFYIWGVSSLFSVAFSIMKNEKMVFFISFIGVLFFGFYGMSALIDYVKLKRETKKKRESNA